MNPQDAGAESAIDIANRKQRRAADPSVSAFVAASAGSGKTKLLIDRLLRLLLAGAAPGRILCLTFTKAAAAEMAIRLRDVLGAWVTMDDATLLATLEGLGVARPQAVLGRARALFGDVLDLPGGMRIETIHAFAQSLLRRFPLEAGITPHFTVADDTEAATRRRDARESVLADRKDEMHAPLLALAGDLGEQDFARLTESMLGDSRGLLADLLAKHDAAPAIEAMQRGALGLVDQDAESVWREIVAPPDEAALRQAFVRIAEDGTDSAKKLVAPMLAWLAAGDEERRARWGDWTRVLITGTGTPRKKSGFINKGLDQKAPGLFDPIEAEQARIPALQERLAALDLARLSSALITLLLPIRAAEDAGKIRDSRLDYGDLIGRAAALLRDPGAAWVLYKLDGGIDHLLLDEVQDIAPAQWAVVDAIAEEFFAGSGRQDPGSRSVFAVGDRKQSIYSFQGADLESFDTWRRRTARRVQAADSGWYEDTLATSFRSTAPVLALVDAVFREGEWRKGVVDHGQTLEHLVSRSGQAGSVSLWPLATAETAEPPAPWAPAPDYARQNSARQRLAAGLARWIAQAIGTMEIASRGRKLTAGDVLILVRRRNEFGPALTRALKDEGVAVAGLDRMVLSDTRAVADLMALARAILLPEDDLSVATVLASPLGDLGDDSLMDLALGRRGSLRAALAARAAERPEWQKAEDFLSSLEARADFVDPYRLFAEALGPRGGRTRLLARLGPEAAEPIDELLATARTYAAENAASLQGFLARLEASDAEIKREAEASGDSVRLMTVHGAKGLQAPLVILPDTTSLSNHPERLFWLAAPQSDLRVPILVPRKEQHSSAVAVEEARRREAEFAENNRLLYVALTRAEDHLVVCGAEGGKAAPELCWYRAVEAGFSRLPNVAETGIDLPWADRALTMAEAQKAAPKAAAVVAEETKPAPPAWLSGAPDWTATPPSSAGLVERLVPSRSAEGEPASLAAASPRQRAAASSGRAAARARGTLVHALLQHLPGLDPTERDGAARRYLASPAHGLDDAAQDDIAGQVISVLAHPALAPLFGPESRAEAPIAGIVGGVEIGGVVDRLAILPDRAVIADYKTDRAPPATVDAAPVAYLGQIAAYAAVLRKIVAPRPVEALLVWTETGAVMPVPEALLARHAPDRRQEKDWHDRAALRSS